MRWNYQGWEIRASHEWGFHSRPPTCIPLRTKIDWALFSRPDTNLHRYSLGLWTREGWCGWSKTSSNLPVPERQTGTAEKAHDQSMFYNKTLKTTKERWDRWRDRVPKVWDHLWKYFCSAFFSFNTMTDWYQQKRINKMNSFKKKKINKHVLIKK